MRAVAFDAYGTLFDVHSVVLRDGHNITGDVQTLSTVAQPEALLKLATIHYLVFSRLRLASIPSIDHGSSTTLRARVGSSKMCLGKVRP
jgi:FMN phosphatase YigB (HAD superfamily)